MTESHIGARLERERLDRGLSQDDAAEQLGISQATFSRWVQGSTPKSTHWTKIARFLKLPRPEVAALVNDGRARGPSGDQLRHLEERFDGLDSRLDELALAQAQVQRLVDEIARSLGPAASPRRRRAR